MAERYVIVNADDFGLSLGVNRGIIEAHECGIVTSTSLMVRSSAAQDAAEYARSRAQLSVGLHLDLGEWTYKDGRWQELYSVVDVSNADSVEVEMSAQLDLFRRLLGRDPTHLDSHQHVHLEEPARSAAIEVSKELRIPLRACTDGIDYCGGFYGQNELGEPFPDGVSIERVLQIVRMLHPGITEVGCHPGVNDGLRTTYRDERMREVAALTDPRVRQALVELRVRLISFSGVLGRVG
jgi:predicted glycoside hydrolase/deacetylase ChbG (UPF0249 family)